MRAAAASETGLGFCWSKDSLVKCYDAFVRKDSANKRKLEVSTSVKSAKNENLKIKCKVT